MKKVLLIILSLLVIFILVACIKSNDIEINNENITETSNETIEFENNELFDVLDYIKGVHPGTAGSSMQALSGCAKLMSVCKSKMALELMVNAWIEKQDKSEFSNINESFSFILENLELLLDGEAKDVMNEDDVQDYVGNIDKTLCEKAVSLVKIIINATN